MESGNAASVISAKPSVHEKVSLRQAYAARPVQLGGSVPAAVLLDDGTHGSRPGDGCSLVPMLPTKSSSGAGKPGAETAEGRR